MPRGKKAASDEEFVEQPDDEHTLWEVLEIVAEKAGQYRVRWAGRNPRTGKPWPLDWVPKKDCTPHLVKGWKEKQAASAKTKDVPSAKAKGKGKAKEVIPSDSEPEPYATRSTRTSSGNQDTPVFKVGPPVGVKRKQTSKTTGVKAKRPPPEDSGSDSGPVPLQQPTRKKRKINKSRDKVSAVPHSKNPPESTAGVKKEPSRASLSPQLQDNNANDATFDHVAQDSRHHVEVPETQPSHKTLVPARALRPPDFAPFLPKRPRASESELDEDPIENSSPAKPANGGAQGSLSSHPSVSPSYPGERELAEHMMESYVNFDLAASSPAGAARRDPYHSLHRPPPQRSESPQHELSDHRSPDMSSLPFPATASTQRAVVDSQSRILAPDSQPSLSQELQAKTELIVELSERLQQKDEEVQALNEQCRACDGELAKLRGELVALRSAQNAIVLQNCLDAQTSTHDLPPTESEELCHKIASPAPAQAHLKQPTNLTAERSSLDGQAAELARAHREVAELSEMLEGVRAGARANPWKAQYEQQIVELQREARYAQAQCALMRKKDERTDDEIRRRAAEEPELRARVAALQAERGQMETTIEEMSVQLQYLDEAAEQHQAKQIDEQALLSRTAAETEMTNGLLRQRIETLEGQLRGVQMELAEGSRREDRLRDEKRSMEEELKRARVLVETFGADPPARKLPVNSGRKLQPKEWACGSHATPDGEECLRRFKSLEDLRRHAYTVHYTP